MGIFGAPVRPNVAGPQTGNGADQRQGLGSLLASAVAAKPDDDISALLAGSVDFSKVATPGLGNQIANAMGPGFFDSNGGWRDVVGSLADTLSTFGGSGPSYWPRKQALADRQAMWGREDAKRQEDHARAVERLQMTQNAPRYFGSGRDQVRYDPASGEASVVYDGPEDYETYAGSMGFAPGDDGYSEAAQDFVLRGSGPTAFKYDRDLETVRQAARAALKAQPTYRQMHPRDTAARPRPASVSNVVGGIVAKVARGEALTPGEQKAWTMYRPGRTPNKGGVIAVQTPAEAAQLPKGTRFRTPDGRVKVVP